MRVDGSGVGLPVLIIHVCVRKDSQWEDVLRINVHVLFSYLL